MIAAVRAFALTSAQIEVLKWLALICMLADHINRVLFSGSLIGWSELGRLAFPLFAAALAFAISASTHQTLFKLVIRLLAVGSITLPISLALWPWWSLNILFTLAFGVTAAVAVEFYRWPISIPLCVLLLGLAFFCEFSVFGFLLASSAVYFARHRSIESAVIYAASLLMLFVVNGNHWAVLTVPVIVLISQSSLQVPRIRHFFYYLYPGHLLVLLVMSNPLGVSNEL